MYETHFAKAIKRTRALGLSLPPVTLRRGLIRLEGCVDKSDLEKIFFDTFGRPLNEEDAGACLAVHASLIEPLQQFLGCQAYLTIGSLSGKEQSYYDFDDAKIRDVLSNGVPIRYSLHSWITLDTLEIVDYTIATTYGAVNNEPKYLKQLVTLPPSAATSSVAEELGLIYTPMLIGDSFWRECGLDKNPRGSNVFPSTYQKPNWFYNRVRSFALGLLDRL